MKYINILIFFTLLFSDCCAQSITPVTLNIAGFTNQQNDYSLTISAGESISITDFNNQNNYKLSSGFLQNFTPLITGLFDNIAMLNKEDFVVSPNPTSGFANLIYFGNQSGQLQFQILEGNSKILFTSEVIFLNNKTSRKIDLTNLPIGVYYLKIFMKTNNLKIKNGIYKIIKI